jgi:menaquinone-specific isochorismate synthase
MTHASPLSLTQHIQVLAQSARLAHSQSGADSSTPTVRISRRIEDTSPLDILSIIPSAPSLYWRSSDGSFEVAGFGAADLRRCDDSNHLSDLIAGIETRLAESPSTVKYFGGIRFNIAAPVSPEWDGYGVATFVLPQLEVLRHDGSSYVAINIVNDRAIEEQLTVVLEIVERLSSPHKASPPQASDLRRDTPDQNTWDENVREVLAILESSQRAQKVVLSRRTDFQVTRPGSRSEVLNEILKSSPLSYGFLFAPDSSTTFLGATPERLYKRSGRSIVSAALAGTTTRGVNQEQDKVLANDLLTSRKNRLEHQIVVDTIASELQRVCASPISTEETTTVRTGSVQHLIAALRGTLRDDATDRDILLGLHPTPAVAGTPTELAMQFIKDHEGYDRGWYTGPIGFLGRDESEFAVALRCALLADDTWRLYVGAGIVSGSDERSEWNELEAKAAPYLKLIQSERHHVRS